MFKNNFYLPLGPNCILTQALIEKGLKDNNFRSEHLPFDWNGFGLGNVYRIIENDYQNVWEDMVIGGIQQLSYNSMYSDRTVHAHRLLDLKYGLISAHDLVVNMDPQKVINKYNKRFKLLDNKLKTYDSVTLVYEPNIELTYSTYRDQIHYYPDHNIMEYLDTSKTIYDVAGLISNKYNIKVIVKTVDEL